MTLYIRVIICYLMVEFKIYVYPDIVNLKMRNISHYHPLVLHM